MRAPWIPALITAGLFSSTSLVFAQGAFFEKVVNAELFSIDGIPRAAQVVPDQGACVFATNALIGALGDADILLLRVNAEGDVIENLTIGDAGGQGYHDVAKEVVQADKHYYITGYTRGIDTSAAHTFTGFLIKVDTALNFIWQKNYILPDQELYAEAMTPSGPSDLLIAGKIYDGSDFQSFVMHTDSTGALLWIKQYSIIQGENIECIRQLPGGDILLSGSIRYGFELVLPFVCKLNSNGDFLWGKTYNYPPGSVERSSFLFMHTTSVDHIQLAGYTDKFGEGSTDYYVVDIDSSGTVNWARTYGGSQFEEPQMVQYDYALDELVMVGTSGSFAALDVPYPLAMRVSASDGTLNGAALYGDTSVYQPAHFSHSCRVGPDQRLLMGSRDDPANDLYIVGTDGNLANNCAYYPVLPTTLVQTPITGAFSATVTVPVPIVNDSALALSQFSNESILCASTTNIEVPPARTELVLRPSIGDGHFHLDLPQGSAPSQLSVLNMQGQRVWDIIPASSEVNLPLGLPSGAYVIHIVDGNGAVLNARYQLE